MKTCSRCIFNTEIPSVKIGANGVCNYCEIHDSLDDRYPLDGSTSGEINSIIKEIKNSEKDSEYDCIVGLSGGCDSSYMLYLLKEKYKLNPLAITFDNTWGSTIAIENILNMTESLGVDLHTHVVNSEEFNDICRSFLYASTPDADTPTDLAIAKLFYTTMSQFNIKYSFCGHSFRSEGTVPLGWTYMDSKYIRSVHDAFGTIPIKTMPMLDIDYWVEQLKKPDQRDRIRLLYYEKYDKESVKTMLSNKFGWQWYGGHHHENEWTKFVKSYLLPRKFGIDKRYVEFSALIRSGQMSREDALSKIGELPEVGEDLIRHTKSRLNLSDEEFSKIMKLEIKSYKDYDNSREFFRENKEFFKDLLEKGLVSKTFYEKYVKGQK